MLNQEFVALAASLPQKAVDLCYFILEGSCGDNIFGFETLIKATQLLKLVLVHSRAFQ